MITLTIDPKKFEGPEQAYKLIQHKRSVVEFIKKLHRRGLVESREFFYAIEFHKNGWVHWHLAVRGNAIVDKSLLGVNQFLDEGYELAELWGHGMVNVSPPPEGDGFEPEHAMNYLTKYIAKQDVGPPDWVLDMKGNFRKFSTSRGLCGEVKSRKAPSDNPKVITKRTPRERVAACAQTSKVLLCEKTIIENDEGEEVRELGRRYRYFADLDEPFKMLKKYKDQAHSPQELQWWLKLQKILHDRDWDTEIVWNGFEKHIANLGLLVADKTLSRERRGGTERSEVSTAPPRPHAEFLPNRRSSVDHELLKVVPDRGHEIT